MMLDQIAVLKLQKLPLRNGNARYLECLKQLLMRFYGLLNLRYGMWSRLHAHKGC